jgi:iron complex outermembrane recepter protein
MQRRLVVLAGIWLLGSLSLVPSARAQEDSGLEDLEMEMFFAPAETVQSAALHTQPLEQSPSAVTVLTREEIRASGARTLPEVLRLVPNMDIYMARPLWYGVGVRGRATEASDTVLMLVDGRDVTMEFFGFPLWAAYPYSMDDVERIEVIRGPGSALYGANAFTGVVHVITRRPGEGPAASFSLRGGEHGQAEVGARADARIGPLAMSASVGAVREDLWSNRGGTGRDLTRGRLDAVLELGNGTRLSLETGGFYGEGLLETDIGTVRLEDAYNAYGRARIDWNDLGVEILYDRIAFDLDVGMELYYSDLELELARLPPFEARNDRFTVQVQHAIEEFHNRLTYRAEYVFNHYFGQALVEPDHFEHRMGLTLQDEFDLGGLLSNQTGFDIPALIITAGLRFDYNSVTDYELSPRAAVVCTPWPHHSFRVGYAHAFLKPTFLESRLHFRLDDFNNYDLTEMNLSNPDLANQVVDSLEMGYTAGLFDERLILRLDFAYNWYSNQIWFEYDPDKMRYKTVGTLRIPDITGPGMSFQNDPTGHHGHDVEIQAIVRPTERSRLYFQAGYRQIFDSETGGFSDREPVWRLGAGADLSTRMGLSAALRAFYTTSYMRDLADETSAFEPTTLVRIPAFLLLNARLVWSFKAGPGEWTTGVEAFNLLDARHRELAGRTNPNGPDFAAERLGRRVVVFLTGELW